MELWAIEGGVHTQPFTINGPTTNFAIHVLDWLLSHPRRPAPEARFTVTPATGSCPLEITVEASASTPPPGTTITAYRWHFGDGATGEGLSAAHTYTRPGNHSLSLAVITDDGRVSLRETAIVSVTCSRGEVFAVDGQAALVGSAPASVANNTLTAHETTRIFLERRLALQSPLVVDSTSIGTFPPKDAVAGGVEIAAGTEIASYLLHFDTDDAGEKGSVGSVTFNADILGVIFTEALLNATDADLGSLPTTSFRAVELVSQITPDTFTISANRRTFSWEFYTTTGQDHLRIITEARFASSEICDNGVDDDGDGAVDCQDSDCPESCGGPGIEQVTFAPEEIGVPIFEFANDVVGSQPSSAAFQHGLLVIGSGGGDPDRDQRLTWYDVSNPLEPAFVAQAPVRGNKPHTTAFWEDKMIDNVPDRRTNAWDFDDRRLLSSFSANGIGTHLEAVQIPWVFRPQSAYAARPNLMEIADLSDPTNPRLVTTIDLGQSLSFYLGNIHAIGNLLVAAASEQRGVAILDVSSPSSTSSSTALPRRTPSSPVESTLKTTR